ncbi:MAG: hypothetical protein NT027_07275 [Proteobacteria bacterium]|nr:hypothetical protein [Pseudomonadota bacterium]
MKVQTKVPHIHGWISVPFFTITFFAVGLMILFMMIGHYFVLGFSLMFVSFGLNVGRMWRVRDGLLENRFLFWPQWQTRVCNEDVTFWSTHSMDGTTRVLFFTQDNKKVAADAYNSATERLMMKFAYSCINAQPQERPQWFKNKINRSNRRAGVMLIAVSMALFVFGPASASESNQRALPVIGFIVLILGLVLVRSKPF